MHFSRLYDTVNSYSIISLGKYWIFLPLEEHHLITKKDNKPSCGFCNSFFLTLSVQKNPFLNSVGLSQGWVPILLKEMNYLEIVEDRIIL